jgi:hypothetical protein
MNQRLARLTRKVVVEEILVPISKDRTPDFVMTRTGTTYRAFFDFPDGEVKDLQKLLGSLW